MGLARTLALPGSAGASPYQGWLFAPSAVEIRLKKDAPHADEV